MHLGRHVWCLGVTNDQLGAAEELMREDIISLENTLFVEFLNGVKENIAVCVKLAYLDREVRKEDQGNYTDFGYIIVTWMDGMVLDLGAEVKDRIG